MRIYRILPLLFCMGIITTILVRRIPAIAFRDRRPAMQNWTRPPSAVEEECAKSKDFQVCTTRLSAFLDVIAWAETGTIGEAGYHVIVFKKGRQIQSFKTHPFVGGWRANQNCAYIRRAGKNICSSASGRYQMMDFNYRTLTKKELVKDFTPDSQDKMALYFLRQKGAIAAIKNGNFERAACKVGGIWASFPCNNYNQPQKKMRQLRLVFDRQVQKHMGQGNAPIAKNPFVPPVKGKFLRGMTEQKFETHAIEIKGKNPHIKTVTTTQLVDRGVKIACEEEKVVAIASGKIKLGISTKGQTVEIQRKGETVVYLGLSAIVVQNGQEVKQGQQIGICRETLELELKGMEDKTVVYYDPVVFFPNYPKAKGYRDRLTSEEEPKASIPKFIKPVTGSLTQKFHFAHEGVDWGGKEGTDPIRAAADGTVKSKDWDDWGLGWYVEVDHGNGWKTIYGHFCCGFPTLEKRSSYVSSIKVQVGEKVRQGQVLGFLGNTGNSTGAHLHFGIYLNGKAKDPLQFVPH